MTNHPDSKAGVVFTAILPDGTELPLTEKELDALDLVAEGQDQFHILQDGTAVHLQLQEADYDKREFVFRWKSNAFRIKVLDRIETMVHKLGLEMTTSSKVNEITAPMPGLVLKVNVAPGQAVKQGEALMILEAMKMENVIAAPDDATVEEVVVKEGDAVDKAQLLVRMA